MTIEELLSDKTKKIKEKTSTIAEWLIDGSLLNDELIFYAERAKDTDKVTCIEAFEYATKKNKSIADERVLKFVTQSLTDKSPRVKWESARVIGNIAELFPGELELATRYLLMNSENDGTVVRWATAFALAEILKLRTSINKNLIPAVEKVSEREQDNAVKKKYLDALKKVKK